MKLLKNEKGITNTMIILAIVAALVLAVAVVLMVQEPEPEPDVDEVIPPVAVAGQQTGPVSVTLVDLAGLPIDGTTAGLSVYLTSPGVYPDIYSVFEELDSQGKLVDPYNPTIIAGSKASTISSAGVISYTVTAKQWLAGDNVNVGTPFGLAILDETPVIATGYNSVVGDILVNARLTPEQAIVVRVVDGQPGYLGSEIEVAPIGALSYFDPVGKTDNHTGYGLEKAINDTITDEDFTVHARLLVADTEIQDITVYADVDLGELNLELDDIEITVDGVKITGTGMTDIADLSTTNPLKKNAPTKTAGSDSTMYVVEGASVDMSRINDNNMVELEVELVDYTADTVLSGLESQITVTLVANNGHKNSDFAIGTFTFVVGNAVSVGSGYTGP